MTTDKVYLVYSNDTNDLIIVLGDILTADAKVKAAGLNPMKLVYTGLKVGLSKMIKQERLFSYYLKDSKGNMIVDDFGECVHVREFRYVDVEQVEYLSIENCSQLDDFIDNSQQIIDSCDMLFVQYGNNIR